MSDENIEKINKWFKENNSFGTYHHTLEEDGEDIYSISSYDISDFNDFLKHNICDLIGIPCLIDENGIRFTLNDLKNTKFY